MSKPITSQRKLKLPEIMNLNETTSSLLIGASLLVGASSCSTGLTNKEQSPNIIYILADDMGYGDLSCLNPESKIKTVNLDRMAQQGMVFTDAHSNSAVCTPTRYGILTGRYAWRSKLKQGVSWSYDEHLIAPERMTVASLLKKNGYATACIGKWHLGLDWAKDSSGTPDFLQPIKNGPNVNGFDYFYGITASLDIPPYFYIENDRITTTEIDTIAGTSGKGFWREGPIGADFKHEDVLPNFTRKALDYISEQAKGEKPFFLYFPLPAPHTPILPTAEWKGKSGLTEYGDFCLMVDDVVGQIMKCLDENEISENTLVVFTSDNGCSLAADIKELQSLGHHPSYIYRGAKADIYEGGHRVPFLMKWPKSIKAGKISNETVCLTDLLATAAAIVNDTLPSNAGEDSYNMLPLMTDEAFVGPLREATVHHSIEGYFSIRKGKWKMEFCAGSGGWSYPTPKQVIEEGLTGFQLYDLEADPSETTNVLEQHPEIVKELTALMAKYVEDGRSTSGEPQPNDGFTSYLKN